jgi:hypothetical protein
MMSYWIKGNKGYPSFQAKLNLKLGLRLPKEKSRKKLLLPHSARRKDLSYPKGIEGWAEEWYYIHQ